MRTTRNDELLIDLPEFDNLAPLRDRPTIYLDQNHWSTVTSAIHWPGHVSNASELEAATQLIALAAAREIVLPMSAAHVSETCKQVNLEKRYHRACTILKLSSGWQLRSALRVRQLELHRALCKRYHQPVAEFPPVITLDPEAIYSRKLFDVAPFNSDLPPDIQRMMHFLSCVSGLFDAMLDEEHLPLPLNPGWARQFQQYAEFLRENPTGLETKRQRTLLKFIGDLGSELATAAMSASVTPQQMSHWTRNHCDQDLRSMPALGLYREVIHEKLSDHNLRWRNNDLIDMMYLTTAVGYCDYVVAERSHASHIANALRRLERPIRVHRTIRSLVEAL
ncbi:hypothetical protein ACLXNF_24415 [Mycobacteroides chelonae]|uniref:hypothetical protein n=1 Tax=Mycobacteroides chelonae TaxID=1774 RepID=UPI0039EB4A7A